RQKLGQKLGQKAKQQKRYRFYSLYGLVCRSDVLQAAFAAVRRNERGARRGWSQSRTDHGDAPKRSGLSGRDSAQPQGEDLSRPTGAAGVYLQGQRKTAAVGHTDGAGSGGAGGSAVDPGADL